MSAKKDHRKRTREKYSQTGFESMLPHEILEFLLFTVNTRKDTKPIAHDLLKKFKDLPGVLDAPYEELLMVEGIGPSGALILKFIPFISRKYMEKSNEINLLNTPELTAKFIVPQFLGRTKETVILVLLDNKCSVISSIVMNEGVVNSININTRTIVEHCIKHNASSIILAHNHPNGTTKPSPQDIGVTMNLKDALKPLQINFLDHIIVADQRYSSMATLGYF